MSRDVELTLLQYVEQVIGGSIWHRYNAVRTIGREALWKTELLDAPLQCLSDVQYDDPAAAAGYLERLALEGEFLTKLRDDQNTGLVSVEGLGENGKVTHVDLRFVSPGQIDFQSGKISSARAVTSVIVTAARSAIAPKRPVAPRRKTAQEIKTDLRKSIMVWLSELEASGCAPQAEREFYRQAQAEFQNPYLSAGLFREVWRQLPRDHPIKHPGRPTRSD